MDNKSIAKVFKLAGQLMELHQENPFRTKAMASAAFKVDKLPFAADGAELDSLSTQPGIGKSTAEKIESILKIGTFPELEALRAQTPQGVIEMLQIKGLGPKKILTIWKDLQIESVGELYYACNENRLIEAKGFGLKTQEDIKKSIAFAIAQSGWFLYARVEPAAAQLLAQLQAAMPQHTFVFTGAYRRKCEVLTSVELLSDASLADMHKHLEKSQSAAALSMEEASLTLVDENNFTFILYSSTAEQLAKQLMLTTASDAHLSLLQSSYATIPDAPTEEAIFASLGLQYIEPELREGLDELERAAAHQLPQLITFQDLQGTLHNHSTYSDGVHSLADMARYTKDTLGLEYFGICDHSKTAVYANGLPLDRLQQQWDEIDRLNIEMAPFKIFKGIESDILSDGSLDYSDEVLAKFDFVVASIHSNLKMEEQRATERLIKAIENPYTTILGHPTGRLLLSRAGYPIDYKKVIDACAANKVVIEINANPLRLDLDWRWHRYALDKGVLLAINPDAHRMEGLADMQYGIHVARKGGLTKKQCLNAFTLSEISTFFQNVKK